MNARAMLRVALGVVVVLAAIGIGVSVYDAGVAQGIAQGAQIVPREAGVAGSPYYGYYGQYARPWGFGFGFFGFLFPLFFLFLVFAILRGIFWGRGGHRRDWDDRVPARFEEWHRRLHEAPSTQS
jgi:hypothetical protein